MLRKLNKPLTRRQAIISLSAVFGIPSALSAYGFGIEPRSPVVRPVNLALRDFPGKMRAVQLSDLHFQEIDRFMLKITKLANSFNPDFVFLTGDLVENYKELPKCIEWLSSLKYKDRIFFSPGNWEHFSNTLSKYDLIPRLKSVGIETLYNQGQTINWNGGKFFLAGIDDAHYGNPLPKNAFAFQEDGLCTIALSHSPVGVHSMKAFRTDLVLSGHTHGGQVRIPGIGAIETPPGSGEFEQGLYEVGKTQLYVNSGIGTSILPVRFMCPPEITHLTITGS